MIYLIGIALTFIALNLLRSHNITLYGEKLYPDVDGWAGLGARVSMSLFWVVTLPVGLIVIGAVFFKNTEPPKWL
jgi:hypothetical protein